MCPVWRHDGAGFSGGWYPTNTTRWQLTILGIYCYGYFIDVMAPIVGDVRVGYHTRFAIATQSKARRIVFERRPRPE